MKSLAVSAASFGLLISSISGAADLPTKISCVENRSSQVCANNSALCTAPPPQSPALLGEVTLKESSENGTIYRHGRLETKTSGGFTLTAEGTADVGGSDQPHRSISLFLGETRGTVVRTIKLSGENTAEFRYSEVKRSERGHENLDVRISCTFKN